MSGKITKAADHAWHDTPHPFGDMVAVPLITPGNWRAEDWFSNTDARVHVFAGDDPATAVQICTYHWLPHEISDDLDIGLVEAERNARASAHIPQMLRGLYRAKAVIERALDERFSRVATEAADVNQELEELLASIDCVQFKPRREIGR